MKHKKIKIAALPFAIAAATAPNAQTLEPAAIYVGPFDVVPTLDISVQNDDNIFQEASGEDSSTLTVVRPAFSAVAEDGVTRYSLSYQLEDGTYDDVVNSDYTDQSLAAGFDWRIDERNLLALTTNYKLGHSARSADGVTALDAADLDEFEDRDLGLNYTFGAPESPGQIIVNYRTQSLDYTTNQATTSVLESDSESFGGTFSVAFGAATRIAFQAVQRSTDFPNDPVQDREDTSFLVGVDWEVTGLTTGSARIGRTKSDLLNAAGDSSSTTGNITVSWSPYEYSTWSFSSSKSVENSDNDVGSFVDTTELGVSLNHQWSETVSMQLSVSQAENDFVGANRSDETLSSEIGFTYAIRRWISVGLSVGMQERDSSDSTLDYDRNTATLRIRASL